MISKPFYSSVDFFRDAEPMMRGVAFVTDVVRKAYGPRGESVEIRPPYGQPRYTKRGDLIIEAISLDDQLEARGANLLKLATGQASGRGTITTAILSEFILRESKTMLAGGVDPFDLQHGIELGVQAATQHLQRQAQRSFKRDQIISIGATAADNDWELGNYIGRLIDNGAAASGIRVVENDRSGISIYNNYTLYVGSTPEIDVEERVMRAETALHSLRDAYEEGIVAGGGAALLHAADALGEFMHLNRDQRLGVDIVRRALEEPARQLAINAGIEPDPVGRVVMDSPDVRIGHDVVNGNFVDMYDAGIVDPLKVVRTALGQAGEVARTFVTAPGVLRSNRPEQVRAFQSNNRQFASVFPEIFEPPAEENSGQESASDHSAIRPEDLIGTLNPYTRSGALTEEAGLGHDATSLAGQESEPEEPPARYLVGNFRERIRKDVVEELTVRVSSTEVLGRSGKLDLEIPPEGITLDILVIATAFEFEGPRQASLFVPPAGDSALAGFRLRALEDGETEVHISAFHLGTKVTDLMLRVIVGDTADETSPPRSVAGKVERIVYKSGDVSMFVFFLKTTDEYLFLWEDEEGWQQPAFAEKKLKELNEAINETAAQIEEIVRLDYSIDLESAKIKLKAHGIDLWDLIPEKIRNRFIDRRDKIKRITIHSEGDPFPWEMLHPFRKEPPFDAEQFLIEQVEICRWVHGRMAPTSIPVHRADFVVADPVELAKASSEVAKVTDLLKKWNEALQDSKIEKIEAANELYDLFKRAVVSLLHFACHQSFDGKIGRIMVKNTPIAPKDFNSYRLLGDTAAFIFMNACRSDRKVPGYTKMDGWASSFLNVGAGAFVGTLWEVRDETAGLFAEALYRALLLDEKPIGEALACARAAVKEKAPGDPTWLAYSFYGDTDARVTKILI